jgi:hypothetical protein
MTESSFKIKFSLLALFLVILVLIGPLIDIGTGYYQGIFRLQGSYDDSLTPGVIYRGFFLIPVFLILAHMVKSPFRFLIYYFGFIFIVGSIFRGATSDDVDLVRDAQRYLKLMLPIVGFVGMLFIGKYFTNNKPTHHFWRTAGLYGFITAFGLVTSDLLGYNLRVYRGVDIASAGLIDSQNSASLILLASLPLILYYIYKYLNNRIILILLIEALWLFSAFQLSTRAALVGIPAIILIYHFVLFLKGQYTKSDIHTILYGGLLVMTIGIGYLIFRGWVAQDIEFVLGRFQLLAEGHFRNRVPTGISYIAAFSLPEHLFGLGDSTFRTVENDLVDIYGKFGLTTFLPFVLFILYMFTRLVFTFFRYKKISTVILIMSMLIYMIHGSTAGHAFLSAPVNNLFLLVYLLSYMEINRFQESTVPTLESAHATPSRGKQVKAPLAYDT